MNASLDVIVDSPKAEVSKKLTGKRTEDLKSNKNTPLDVTAAGSSKKSTGKQKAPSKRKPTKTSVATQTEARDMSNWIDELFKDLKADISKNEQSLNRIREICNVNFRSLENRFDNLCNSLSRGAHVRFNF